MATLLITALLYALFVFAFRGGLRLVPGQVGRKSFFFGVQAITLVAWIIIADAGAVGASNAALGIDTLAALISETNIPRFGWWWTRPSRARRCSASRIGVRPMPSRAISTFSASTEPGASSNRVIISISRS